MTSPTHHDVLIVGARAAGAATALLLARAGLDVAVVDRGRYGADTLSTHALMRAGVLQLHRWGVLDTIIAAGTPPVRRTTFTYTDTSVPIPVKPALGVDALYAPRRTVLDPILVDAARAAGATVVYDTSVTALTRDGRGRVNGLQASSRHGGTNTHTARWVIGADGVRSSVAASVDAPVERRGVGFLAATYGYWLDLPVDGYHWIFRPNACAGAIPTNNGLTCVFAVATPDRIGRGRRETFDQIVREASPALADSVSAATPTGALRTFTGIPGFMRHPWGAGWALVGDAGYWKDPISAHGLTDALRDAEVLANALIAASDGTDETEALVQYHDTRNRLSTHYFDIVDAIARMNWTDDDIPALLFQLSEAMTDEIDAVAQLDAATLTGRP